MYHNSVFGALLAAGVGFLSSGCREEDDNMLRLEGYHYVEEGETGYFALPTMACREADGVTNWLKRSNEENQILMIQGACIDVQSMQYEVIEVEGMSRSYMPGYLLPMALVRVSIGGSPQMWWTDGMWRE